MVHCAAGVGRTGTFIALYHLMEELDEKVTQYLIDDGPNTTSGDVDGDVDEKITIDVFQTVFNLRKKRCEMVRLIVNGKNKKYYMYLYRLKQLASK